MARRLAVLVVSWLLACGGGSDDDDVGPREDAGVDAASPDGCVPATCAGSGVACGPLPDGCGGTLDCGACRLELEAVVQVGATPEGHESREPSVAVTAAGRVHVVFMDEDPERRVTMLHAASDDGGATFSIPEPLDCGPGALCGDPDVHVDAQDGVWLAHMSIEPSDPQVRHVVAQRLDPAREEWIQVDDDTPPDTDREWAAFDPQGRLVVAYRRAFGQKDGEIRVAVSDEEVSRFGASVGIPPADAPWGALFAPIAIAPDGVVHAAVALGHRDGISVRAIHTTRSTDGGASFATPVPLPDVVEPQPTSLPELVYFFASPSIDVAPDGTAHVAWGNQSLEDPDEVHVVVATAESGDAFSEPVRVDDGDAVLRMMAWIDVDERGLVHVVWLELDAAASGWTTRYALSSDGGRTFGPSVALSAAPFGGGLDAIGEFIDVTARDGRVHVAWSEGHEGVEDVVVASGRLVAAE